MITEFILTRETTPEQMEKLYDAFKKELDGPAISLETIAKAVNKAISGTLYGWDRFSWNTNLRLSQIAEDILR